MKSLLTILIVLIVSGCSSTLIGKSVPPYPEGLETKHGACIAHALGRDRFCEIAVGDLRKVGKEPFALIVQREIGRSGKNAIWQVTDQISWPKQVEGTYVSLGVCNRNGVIDHSIIAVVIQSEEQWHLAAGWAMKVNLENGKFSPISPEGVKCENEGWGV
ncbi:hypothetical protein SAMN02745127_01922 [Oceanospirillum multiglobuliferum]|uniref:Lipoprotein n=1 Tax=Oceanospirillum multiglobuliferum TaxID=64969 RepID=A0A1T4QM09_9GAMM|nr:hypothetical protein [Oceanospirillum multiglobuliferum]OPX56427.1 hypothetical protein BTE48_03080 [Oceanospirillum multiglobuliferum]SKA04501.1 hypothetical protein SAMN02745127_01922 [Oceanospirillum multiglobuliferum]